MTELPASPDVREQGTRPLDRVADVLESRGASTQATVVERVIPAPTSPAMVVERPAAVVVKTPLREDVEAALADGLEETYAALPTATQAMFRARGESLAERLEAMVAQGTFAFRDVYQGVASWLRLLPSTGRFARYYLDQETKVKVDALVALARHVRGL